MYTSTSFFIYLALILTLLWWHLEMGIIFVSTNWLLDSPKNKKGNPLVIASLWEKPCWIVAPCLGFEFKFYTSVLSSDVPDFYFFIIISLISPFFLWFYQKLWFSPQLFIGHLSYWFWLGLFIILPLNCSNNREIGTDSNGRRVMARKPFTEQKEQGGRTSKIGVTKPVGTSISSIYLWSHLILVKKTSWNECYCCFYRFIQVN